MVLSRPDRDFRNSRRPKSGQSAGWRRALGSRKPVGFAVTMQRKRSAGVRAGFGPWEQRESLFSSQNTRGLSRRGRQRSERR